MEVPLHHVILAGGSGTRFWPASRRNHPKQFLALAGGAEFVSGLRRLRESFRAEAKRLLRTKRTEAPVPFRDAEGPALASTAEGLEREWAELAARLAR